KSRIAGAPCAGTGVGVAGCTGTGVAVGIGVGVAGGFGVGLGDGVGVDSMTVPRMVGLSKR
ncbi:MAG: hypothetical protein ACJ795_11675, partial [Ktedonobacteraceae bacterium]